MYYVYVLANTEGKTYTGYTRDLKRRISEHTQGDGYTKSGSTWQLCYYEAFFSEQDAFRRERALKKSSQARRWLRERIKESVQLCRES
jgi:putative endonuclease